MEWFFQGWPSFVFVRHSLFGFSWAVKNRQFCRRKWAKLGLHANITHFAQSKQNCARLHDRVILILRNSGLCMEKCISKRNFWALILNVCHPASQWENDHNVNCYSCYRELLENPNICNTCCSLTSTLQHFNTWLIVILVESCQTLWGIWHFPALAPVTGC